MARIKEFLVLWTFRLHMFRESNKVSNFLANVGVSLNDEECALTKLDSWLKLNKILTVDSAIVGLAPWAGVG